MKFAIEKNQLLQVLSIISKGMSSRSTLPILSGIYIKVSSKSIVFQTTDLEVSIKHTINALIEEEGATVVPGKLFTDIIKSLPEAAISFSLEQDNVLISCLDSQFSLHTLNPEDFPNFPEVVPSKSIIVPSNKLSSMIKKVSKAVSKDESRAVLTGILFKAEEDTIQLVATDSYRLAITKTKTKLTTLQNFELIIPGIIFDEIGRLSISEETVEISDSDNQIIFKFGNTTFITRKIEGTFPNYNQIIPTEKLVSATIETSVLLSAVRRASILAQAHSPIKLSFSTSSQHIDISSNTQDIGRAYEKISAQIEGDEIEIGFNHQYIIDGLAVVDTDEILFEAQTPLKPGIIKTIGEDYFFYLTMPVKLDK